MCMDSFTVIPYKEKIYKYTTVHLILEHIFSLRGLIFKMHAHYGTLYNKEKFHRCRGCVFVQQRQSVDFPTYPFFPGWYFTHKPNFVYKGVFFVYFWRDTPQWARASSFTRSLYHIQRRTSR